MMNQPYIPGAYASITSTAKRAYTVLVGFGSLVCLEFAATGANVLGRPARTARGEGGGETGDGAGGE
jgi:hypothetical protein